MANRFFSPDEQFCDETGAPYAGGFLYFYASGTSTPLATYSDRALTIANSNPVVLDSAGRAGAVFLQNLAYKAVLQNSDADEIWNEDPVYTSDFSATAQFQSGTGSPNGSVAGNAGSATVPASVYWDATAEILYVCTQTGSATTAIWTAINAASANAAVPTPQGRLTVVSGDPLPSASSNADEPNVYYTPYSGNTVPLYTGAIFSPQPFTELTLSLVASHLANTNYDVFVFSNSGVLVLVTGPAWDTATSRGTGAGTTQLTTISGIPVNNVSMTGRNGATTYSIGANLATYLGTIRINSSAGLTDDSFVKRFVWNYYNRAPRQMFRNESAASWTYSTAAFRIANGNTANMLQLVRGFEYDTVYSYVMGRASGSGATLRDIAVGIGSDSQTSNAAALIMSAQVSSSQFETVTATSIGLQGIGYHYLAWLEYGGGADTQTWVGTTPPLGQAGIAATVFT